MVSSAIVAECIILRHLLIFIFFSRQEHSAAFAALAGTLLGDRSPLNSAVEIINILPDYDMYKKFTARIMT